jgi:hypothetical protein
LGKKPHIFAQSPQKYTQNKSVLYCADLNETLSFVWQEAEGANLLFWDKK